VDGTGIQGSYGVSLQEQIKNKIKHWEDYHSRGFKRAKIILGCLLGLVILFNLGLYFRDSLANVVGIGITKTKNIGVIIGSIGAIVGVGSLILNIIKGTFSVAKFASGFNIFTGQVQGKLIYYGILAILGFALYHQLTRATVDYNTDYRNNIRNNRDVYIDQRVGDVCAEKCAIAIQPFGITILKAGCVKSCTASITQQTKTDEKKEISKVENKKIKKERNKCRI
jgi:hypothetical protein